MSSLDLFKGYWRPLKFLFVRSGNEGQGAISILGSNAIYPLNHVGKKIELTAPKPNQALAGAFEVTTGQIVDRIKLIYEDGRSDIDWFLVALREPMAVVDDYQNDKLLIKIRNASLVHGSDIDCWLNIVPHGVAIKPSSSALDFLNCGKVIINGIHEGQKEA